MMKGLQFAKWALVGMWTLASACVTAPYDGQGIVEGNISVSGYMDVPNASPIFKMKNFRTGNFDVITPIAPIRSSSSPNLPAWTWRNSPALYYWSGSLPSRASRTISSDYWNSSDDHAILRVEKNANEALYGGMYHSMGCMASAPKSVDFYESAGNCDFDQLEIDLYQHPPIP